MKKYCTYLFLLFTVTASLGQAKTTGKPYFFIGAEQLYKLTISKDTISIYRCSSYSDQAKETPESVFRILGRENRSGYNIYYVEELVHFSMPVNQPVRFKPIMIKYSANGEVAEVLAEADTYETMAECKRHLAAEPGSKLLVTYFSGQKLQSFLSYTRVRDLDSASTDRLFLALRDEMLLNKDKIVNTHFGDLYGSITVRELMNRTMIKQRVYPLASDAEITKKARTSPAAKQME